MSRWVEKWDVVGTSGKPYVVSRDADGRFGCSCPAWKFQCSGGAPRKDCAHIANKKVELMQTGQMSMPEPTRYSNGIPIGRSNGSNFPVRPDNDPPRTSTLGGDKGYNDLKGFKGCNCPISFKGIPDMETQIHKPGCKNAGKEKKEKKDEPSRSIRFD